MMQKHGSSRAAFREIGFSKYRFTADRGPRKRPIERKKRADHFEEKQRDVVATTGTNEPVRR
jgi:hypothetical protein